MSCDAAGQRSRARSRSRAGGLASVFNRFKTAQNDNSDDGRLNGTTAGCSNLPRPPSSFEQPVCVTPAAVTAPPAPPLRRDTAADAYFYRPPPSPMPVQDNSIACLRDVIRPKSETGSGQTYAGKTSDHRDQVQKLNNKINRDQGPIGVAPRWYPEGENQHPTSAAFRLQRPCENNPTAQQRGPTTMANKTGHMAGNQFSHSQISSSGHQVPENQSTRFQLETTQWKHPENLQGRNHSSHQLGIQSRAQKGHNPTDGVYLWTRDSNREGPQLSVTLRNRPVGHLPQRPQTGDAAWRPTPPPPPPRTSAPILTSFQSETASERNAGQFATVSRGRHPPPSENPTVQKFHNRSGEGCYTNPYSSAPSLYHPSREPSTYAGSMAQLSICNALPAPIVNRSIVEPSQRKFRPVSPTHSPLPPFPDAIGVPDYQPLPPPPPPDLIESYLPPPPMFHSPPPPASTNPHPFSYAPGRPDSRGNLATERRQSSEEGSKSAPAMESALFAAILRRRQAIEASRHGIFTES